MPQPQCQNFKVQGRTINLNLRIELVDSVYESSKELTRTSEANVDDNSTSALNEAPLLQVTDNEKCDVDSITNLKERLQLAEMECTSHFGFGAPEPTPNSQYHDACKIFHVKKPVEMTFKRKPHIAIQSGITDSISIITISRHQYQNYTLLHWQYRKQQLVTMVEANARIINDG
ncbi:hypothetical protein F4604DRAFT_1674868 [Suillus subluteus]|nr:hypothetical protein F4604DRAFT_1674868 [Suillus subluteus]